MRRKIKPIDLNELIDADDINRTTIKGEMRKLYPAIHKKLVDGGWSAKDMVLWLGERGIEISVELFRVYLRDLDRERGYERSAKKFREAAPAHIAGVHNDRGKSIAVRKDPSKTTHPKGCDSEKGDAGVKKGVVNKSAVPAAPGKLTSILRGEVDLKKFKNK